MTSRERFVRTLTGEKVDRVPFMKIFGGVNASHAHWENEHPGIRTTIDTLLQFEGANRGWAPVPGNMDPSRMYPARTIEEKENIVIQDRGDGTIVQWYKGGDYARHTIGWPIKDRKTWEAYKEKHLDPNDASRFPANWKALAAEYKTRDYPLQLTHRGVYGFPRERMGDENLALAFYDMPDVVHDIMNYYTDMAIAVWEKMCADVEFDVIECWEDMASKNGSLISPEMFREFMTPCYEKIADFAKRHNIKVILVDSDGLVENLTGLMQEGGVTAMYPYEVLAGNDPFRVRKKYPTMGIVGGLRKEAMIDGKDAIDKEIKKAKEMIKLGRCIPGPDHFVLKVVNFREYRYFMEKLREVVMTTAPGT